MHEQQIFYGNLCQRWHKRENIPFFFFFRNGFMSLRCYCSSASHLLIMTDEADWSTQATQNKTRTKQPFSTWKSGTTARKTLDHSNTIQTETGHRSSLVSSYLRSRNGRRHALAYIYVCLCLLCRCFIIFYFSAKLFHIFVGKKLFFLVLHVLRLAKANPKPVAWTCAYDVDDDTLNGAPCNVFNK